MMDSERIDVNIGLPTGAPSGIRIAEMSPRGTGVVRAVLVPKSMLKDLDDLKALKAILVPNDSRDSEEHPECKAVYLLLGKPKDSPRPAVYVGLTDTPWERFADHLRKKKFDIAIVVTSRSDCGFGYDDIRWLEWYCLKQALGANQFEIKNKQQPGSQSSLNCKGRFEVFNTISVLVSVLGFPVFEMAEPVVDHLPKDETLRAVNEVFHCRGEDADAVGQLVKGGFQVQAGSVVRLRVAPHAVKTVGQTQKELHDKGILVAAEPGKLRFTRDYVFTKPSPAASLVLGRSANGSIEWESEDGRTLGEILEAGGKE